MDQIHTDYLSRRALQNKFLRTTGASSPLTLRISILAESVHSALLRVQYLGTTTNETDLACPVSLPLQLGARHHCLSPLGKLFVQPREREHRVGFPARVQGLGRQGVRVYRGGVEGALVLAT